MTSDDSACSWFIQVTHICHLIIVLLLLLVKDSFPACWELIQAVQSSIQLQPSEGNLRADVRMTWTSLHCTKYLISLLLSLCKCLQLSTKMNATPQIWVCVCWWGWLVYHHEKFFPHAVAKICKQRWCGLTLCSATSVSNVEMGLSSEWPAFAKPSKHPSVYIAVQTTFSLWFVLLEKLNATKLVYRWQSRELLRGHTQI